MKVSSFDQLRFSDEINIRRLPQIAIDMDLAREIAKKLPPSLKDFGINNGVMRCHVKSGAYSVNFQRYGNYIIKTKRSEMCGSGRHEVSVAIIK